MEELGIDIKRETFRSWCHEIGMVKKAKKRRSRPRNKRERMSQPGLFLQMDGSFHHWFGDRETYLVAIIDDASSEERLSANTAGQVVYNLKTSQ